jgi:hypothetical protein
MKEFQVRVSLFIIHLLTVFLLGSLSSAWAQEETRAMVPTKEQIADLNDIVSEAVKSIQTKAAGDPVNYAKRGSELLREEEDAATKWVLGTRLIEELSEFNLSLEILDIIAYLDSLFEIKDFGSFYAVILKIDAKTRKEHLGKRLSTLGPILTLGRMAARNGDKTTIGKITAYELSRVPPEIRPSFQLALDRLKQSTANSISLAEIVESASSKLKANPEDGNALAILGVTNILADQKLQEGSDLLTRSKIKNYQEIGELEKNGNKSNDQLFELATKWWSVSEKMPNCLRDLAKKRSVEMYRNCAEQLRGLNKVVAEKRMSEVVVADDGMFSLKIDLLGPTVVRRINNGEMKPDTKQLFLRSAGPSYVQFEIPYSSNYEVEYRFSRSRTAWGITLFFCVSGRQYGWTFSGANIGTLGFIGARNQDDSDVGISRKILSEGTHSVSIKVRPERLEATLDGQLEGFVDNPLKLKHFRPGGNQPELLDPYFQIHDWWGDTTIESAILTQYW